MPTHYVVHTTVDSAERAEAMATMMVNEGIAACVHLISIRSIYRWKGQVEDADEYRLEAKTRASDVDRLMEFIRVAHPYDTPEIVALPIAKGDARYLEWLDKDITPKEKK